MSRLFLEAEKAKARKAKAEGLEYTPKTLYQLGQEARQSPNISTSLNRINIRDTNTINSFRQNFKILSNSHKALLKEFNSTIKNINNYAELAQTLTKNSNSTTKKKLKMNLKEAMNKLQTLKNNLNLANIELGILKTRKHNLNTRKKK